MNEARRDARSLFAMTALILLAVVAYIVIDANNAGLSTADASFRFAHVGLSIAALVWLWRRRHPTRATNLLAFCLLMIPYLPSLWVADAYLARSGQRFTPFIGQKYLMFCVAVFAPRPAWLGPVTVAVFSAEEVAIWHSLHLGGPDAQVAQTEPWDTVVFSATTVALLAYRHYHFRLEAELERARAEAASLETVTRTFLAVRDRANTPLQTLEVGTRLLERACPGQAETIERMHRSLTRLRQLSETLKTATPRERRG